jgi:hypothetical protein
MKNVVFWDVKIQFVLHPVETLVLTRATRRSVLRLLVTANIPSSPIVVTLVNEAIRSFEASVLTRSTRRHMPVDGILNAYPRFLFV